MIFKWMIFTDFKQEVLRQNEAENAALREAINEKDAESQKHLNILDAKLQELENLKKNIGNISYQLTILTYRETFQFTSVLLVLYEG